jgi:hypothetical protein
LPETDEYERFYFGQVEKLVYSEDGKLNQKHLAVLDDKGNEIERTRFNVSGIQTDGDIKYSIEYDSFDEKGNWTKKDDFKVGRRKRQGNL